MRKILGLTGFLLVMILATCALELAQGKSISFVGAMNVKNLLTSIGLFGILSLGQAFVIVTGGIDLSVGSLAALVSVWTAMLMNKGEGYPAAPVIVAMLLLCVAIGAWHGLLITKARMQPFVVTLCGLFFYRGIARVISGDSAVGFGNEYQGLKWFGRGTLWDLVRGVDQAEAEAAETYWQILLDCVPAPFLILLALAVVVAALVHFMPYGRHLLALGSNEDTARFSGIRTDYLKITAYILCSVISGFAAILMAFKINSVQANSFGNFYELYAIAGAVLGGCSLRGGSGNIAAVLLGSAIIRVLANMVNILGIASQLEYVVIGGAILVGVFVDEMLARRAVRRATRA